jgi:L-aminopeptidase/D-esterase-like protein
MTLTSVPGVRVGHAEVPGKKSGCTVILGPFRGAVEVRGMATGTRELGVLSPYHLVSRVNAVLLTGGSAFGLAAADGVMEFLAELGEGFDTGIAPVPLVPAAVIFDLDPGVARPGRDEGRRASETASTAPVLEGQVGAGAGATVGKLLGPATASAGGIGSTSRKWRGSTVGVLAVVNALGDVVADDGAVLAGIKGPAGPLQRSDSIILEGGAFHPVMPGTNTTLAVVATDLPLSRVDLGMLAKMASSAFPRAISPVNTPFDGDLVFSLSTGKAEILLPPEDLLALGVVARELTEEAIRRAVTVSGGAEGASLRKEP